MRCRDEVLVCAASLAGATTQGTFTIKDMINCMKSKGTLYAESTIRTHVSSRMCGDAPDNHEVSYDDLERVGHGMYRLRP